MFRKLDKLVIKAFIGPFVAVFFITLLVLVMQFFWLWIDDFIGKGLSAFVILEFIVYQSTVLVPLALPLAVLLSSLMTFGNLGESMELVAIKSSGISLLRFMRPLFIVSILIAGLSFLFHNYVIPVAALKSRTLLADIVYAKPSFDLKEGVFYDKIDGFAIKIGKKQNDSVIRDVIIYERGANALQDNFIIAESGVMGSSEDKRFLELNLVNGWRYQERGSQFENDNTEFIRIGFKEYKKQLDLTSFEFRRTADTLNRNSQRMRSMRQIQYVLDSISRDLAKFKGRTERDVFSIFSFQPIIDSGYDATKVVVPDSINSMDQIIPDSVLRQVNQSAASTISTTLLNTEVIASEYKIKSRDFRLFKIEWHKKLTFAIACVILFLIGAPLGSIIRKGGLGTPLVIAVIFFVFFFFFNSMGEKAVKENVLTPTGGMWMASMVLLPIGIFLTYKALHDSQLFNKEFYFRLWKKFKAMRAK